MNAAGQDSDPDRRAAAVGDFIRAGDRLGHALGITIEDVRPGYARATMPVTEAVLNAVGICHGGATFALADIAFACACNSHNRTSLAANCTVTFTSAVGPGEVLTAEAQEVTRNGRSGVYDIRVTDGRDRVVALVRGHARQVQGEVVAGLGGHD